MLRLVWQTKPGLAANGGAATTWARAALQVPAAQDAASAALRERMSKRVDSRNAHYYLGQGTLRNRAAALARRNEGEELNVIDEVRFWRNDRRVSRDAIAFATGNVYPRDLAAAHLWDGFLPPKDDLALADLEGERPIAGSARIKAREGALGKIFLFAFCGLHAGLCRAARVHEKTFVVNSDGVAALRVVCGVAGPQGFDPNFHVAHCAGR
mmetsp:Transcript_16843/g.42755  ORF Transcript_16843/g.42755 Transcript_16843/m.42755 type:complete len:211 (+) Transcript_16843:53-685(+)